MYFVELCTYVFGNVSKNVFKNVFEPGEIQKGNSGFNFVA